MIKKSTCRDTKKGSFIRNEILRECGGMTGMMSSHNRGPVQMGDSGQHFWEAFYSRLQKEIPGQFFDVFFRDLIPIEWNEERLVLESADQKVLSHIGNRYMKLITGFAREISHTGVKIELQMKGAQSRSTEGSSSQSKVSHNVKGAKKKKSAPSGQEHLPLFSPENENHSAAREKEARYGYEPGSSKDGFSKIYINPHYTFERFIKGPSNEHALAAALGAAQNPMKYHNPLYLFGGVGLGKTHLLMSIANHIEENFPWLKVLYVPSEIFQSDLIEAFANKNLPAFKTKYRNVDVLLIDDIQFISQRAEFTQETIFHTFNYLYQNNKQIVISGDRPPQQLSKLKDRLVSRFQSGLIVDIKPPEMETREAIIKSRAREMGFELPGEVVKYITVHIKEQIRLLEASLIRLKFTSEYEKKEIDIDMARRVLVDLPQAHEEKSVSVNEIIAAVSKSFLVVREDILGRSRLENIVLARHVCMYLVRSMISSYSLLEIAELFGRKDHTTVINAEKKIIRMIEHDSGFKSKLEELKEGLEMIQQRKTI